MDFAQQVKSSVDIVNVVREYVRLRKSGVNRWTGLCPFHTEKTPSFSVHEALQIYKCFGCGKGGDVFSFLMEMQGLTFYEALVSLAQQHGIAIPKRGSDDHDGESHLRGALYRMHELAAAYFRSELQSARGAAVRKYLAGRGVAGEAIEQFALGYAPNGSGLTQRLRREGFSAAQLEQSGLVSARQDGSGLFDRFRERLTFPIYNESGKIIAFGGRTLQADNPVKYLNSPETAIYKKNSVLYNLHRAKQTLRQAGRAVLVEGYMDVIGVAAAGVAEVVASCGTALTSQQARMIRRHADIVVVNFDSDSAGQDAAERSIDVLLQEDLKVRVLALPEGKDPDEFCRNQGADSYRELLDRAPDYFTWLADRARSRFDMKTAEGRLDAFKFLVPALQRLPDKIQRASLADELASYLGLENRSLALEQIRRAAVERRQTSPAAPAQDAFSHAERILARLLVESGDARGELLTAVVETVEGLPSAPLFAALAAVHATGVEFHFSALEGRLDEHQRDLLTRLLFERDQPACSLDEGRQAFEALRRMVLERRLVAVRRQIAEAERSGDRARCFELLKLRTDLAGQLGLSGKAAGAS